MREVGSRRKFPKRKVIAVDVDGTLIINGTANSKLVSWIKKKKKMGFEIYIWSARGKAHADFAVEFAKIENDVDAVISKPFYIVDDLGWSWIRETEVVTELR